MILIMVQIFKKCNATKLHKIFNSNLNQVSKGTFKPTEQRSALKTIKFHYKSRQSVIKLFNDYSSITSEAKHEVKYGKY